MTCTCVTHIIGTYALLSTLRTRNGSRERGSERHTHSSRSLFVHGVCPECARVCLVFSQHKKCYDGVMTQSFFYAHIHKYFREQTYINMINMHDIHTQAHSVCLWHTDSHTTTHITIERSSRIYDHISTFVPVHCFNPRPLLLLRFDDTVVVARPFRAFLQMFRKGLAPKYFIFLLYTYEFCKRSAHVAIFDVYYRRASYLHMR